MSESAATNVIARKVRLFEMRPVESRKPLIGQLFWFLMWLGTTAFGIYLRPDPHTHGTHQQLGLPPCPSVLAFHRPCPGCGLTTSFTATIHGDLFAAFRAHSFGPVLYLLFTLTGLVCGWCWWKKIRFDTDTRAFNVALGTLVGCFLIYGAIRFAIVDNYGPNPALNRSATK